MTGDRAWEALDAVPEAVVLVDANGLVAHVNDRARFVLELSDDVVGSPAEQAVELWDGDEPVTKRL
ncbi:MAG TPA: hypothetical protein VGA36_04535, partial [Nitriliruptorales bacterium]